MESLCSHQSKGNMQPWDAGTTQHSTAQHGTAQHALMLMSSAMQQGNHYSFHVSSLGLVAQAFSDTRLPNP